MTEPLVSIVIPVYNTRAWLDRCLESVTGQSYRNLQIILVDDGSTDGSGDLCRIWTARDSRIECLRIPNSGQGAATNRGIEQARGDYIFFFDSDDYVDNSIVETCVRTALEDHSDAVSYGRWDVRPDGRKTGMPLRISQTCYRGDEIKNRLLPDLLTYRLGLGMGTCGRMYRLALLRELELGFQSRSCGGSEDVLFALKFLAAASAVSILPQRLYYYCRRGDSVSASYRPDRQDQNDRFLQNALAWAKARSLPQQVLTALKVRYHQYTIAAMKQALSAAGNGRPLNEIFENPILRETLTAEVVDREKLSQRCFFLLLKARCYSLCRLLLRLKP